MTNTTHPPVSHESVDLTPATAKKWLETYNRHNRPIFPYHWRDLMHDMLDGNFHETGENGVSFDWDGYICGGQHTLTALAEAGETNPDLVIRLRVTKNVNPADRAVMNDTLKQRFAHDLATQGVGKNAQQLESLMRVALLWDRTALIYRGKGGIATFRSAAKYTRPVLMQEWPKYAATLVDTMNATATWNNSEIWPGNRGAMQFTYWLLVHRAECNPAAVTDFFNKISYGSSEQDRTLLLKLRTKFKDNTDKHLQVFWMIKVWNMLARGENPSKLQAPRDSVTETGKIVLTDPYPKILKVR